MGGVVYLPVVKISRQMRRVIDATHEWESRGFPNEVAAAAGTLCLYIDRLERRIKKLEKKSSSNRQLAKFQVKLPTRKLKSNKGA